MRNTDNTKIHWHLNTKDASKNFTNITEKRNKKVNNTNKHTTKCLPKCFFINFTVRTVSPASMRLISPSPAGFHPVTLTPRGRCFPLELHHSQLETKQTEISKQNLQTPGKQSSNRESTVKSDFSLLILKLSSTLFTKHL